MANEKQYLQLYSTQADLLQSKSCSTLNKQREKAATMLERNGLPTTKVERYKYTDADAFLAPDFGLNLQRITGNNNPYASYRCNVPGLSTHLYYVVNDVVCAPQNEKAALPEGVVVTSICQAATSHPEIVEKYYHQAAGREYDGITALNTMLVQDGLFIYLPEGTTLSQPLQIVNISAARVDLMSNRRLLIIAEANANAAILLCDHAEGEQKYLTTQVVEIFANEGAKVDLYSIEETNENNTRFCNLYAELQKGSHVTFNGVTLHNGRTRNRLDFRMLGEGATVGAYGSVIADGKEHVDNSILATHAASSCQSDMLYKYVLDGSSVGAFAGKVLVEEGAQKSLSQQTNANLCASPEARAYSQPMLEIYADDVKCNHGSTIGKLDENALFYMRQRGIEESEARLLLQHAFVNEVLQRIQIDYLRERISHLVEKRFRGELQQCQGCKMCVR